MTKLIVENVDILLWFLYVTDANYIELRNPKTTVHKSPLENSGKNNKKSLRLN
jgi:hypothetical protein